MEKNFLGKGDGVNNLASQALVSGAIFSSPWETLSGAKQTPRQIWQRVKNRGNIFHSTGNIARRPKKNILTRLVSIKKQLILRGTNFCQNPNEEG